MRPIRTLLLAAACASTLDACGTPDRGSVPAGGTDPASNSTQVLTGRLWTLVALDGKDIDAKAPPTLSFDQGRVSGFGGINRLAGTYTLEGHALTFGALASTRMAGDPALMELEGAFGNALERVDAFRVTGNELALTSHGAVVAKFRGTP